MERCLSGRKGHPAKVLGSKGSRGFESLPLRKICFAVDNIIDTSIITCSVKSTKNAKEVVMMTIWNFLLTSKPWVLVLIGFGSSSLVLFLGLVVSFIFDYLRMELTSRIIAGSTFLLTMLIVMITVVYGCFQLLSPIR